MKNKVRRFADDGWAVWIEGDDTSAFYLDEWVNPTGKSFVDVAIRIRDIDDTHGVYVFAPFHVEKDEIVDVSVNLLDPRAFRAVFNSTGIVDAWKNDCTSALAYHGRVVDLVHISKIDFTVRPVAGGSLISLSIDSFADKLDGDEIYLIFRLPHKSIDAAFAPTVNAQGILGRLRDLFVSPVIVERYGCSVRVNEMRMLPQEISRMGMLHRQKLDRAVVTIHLGEDYQITAAGCERIHRLERDLYESHAPEGFELDGAIVYHWRQSRETSLRGHFNFYFDIHLEKISGGSILIYAAALLVMGLLTEVAYDGLCAAAGALAGLL